MQREWRPEDLIECWTLGSRDEKLLANKSGSTRLGFALMLKFFELEGRFPRHAAEIPRAAVDCVAGQVKVGPTWWLVLLMPVQSLVAVLVGVSSITAQNKPRSSLVSGCRAAAGEPAQHLLMKRGSGLAFGQEASER